MSWQTIGIATIKVVSFCGFAMMYTTFGFRISNRFSRLSSNAIKSSQISNLASSNEQPQNNVKEYIYKDDYDRFVYERNWKIAEQFWPSIIKQGHSYKLPDFVQGNTTDFPFGVSELEKINKLAQNLEFKSGDRRYTHRQNFALRVGYDGTEYFGYQQQKTVPTVEADIKKALKFGTCPAGRTDRGVSAVSQVVCFHTHNMTITEESLLEKCRNYEASKNGKLVFYDCQRVSKGFNSRFSARWRRYLYLFPLNVIQREGDNEYDVDIDRLNKILSRLVARELPYNAMAYKEDRNTGEGMLDLCTLFHAKATLIKLKDHMEFKDESKEQDYPTLCIELVGTRFLRRMVRILLATAIRESTNPLTAVSESYQKQKEEVSADDDILVNICLSRNRDRAATALPGDTLCLAGVGFDEKELALYKFMKKTTREKVLEDWGFEEDADLEKIYYERLIEQATKFFHS